MADDYVDIPFGPFLPDLGGSPDPKMPGYLTDAVGVRLTPSGYRGLPTFTDVTSAAVIGGTNSFWQPTCCLASNGTPHFFVLHNTDGKIYESTDEGQTWADSTPAAGAAPTFPGHFFTYEDDVIFVCDARAAIKRNLLSAAGTDFSDLGGSPPTATCGAQVRQHVVLGGLIGVNNFAVQWSAIGDHEDWPTPGSADALAKESGREILPQSLGLVKFVLGGEKIGIVVQEQGLTRMTYEGGNTVYAFDTYETKIGYGHQRRSYFATDGKLWYWYNDHGFFVTDGYSADRLDDGRIEDAIFNDLLSFNTSVTPLPGTYCQSTYDPHRHMVIFGNHEKDYQLAFDVASGSFTLMNEATMTGPFVGRSTNLQPGNTKGMTVYNINQSSRKLQVLGGTGPTIAMQTGYIEIDPGYRVQLHGAHLLGAGSIGSLTLSYKTAADQSACDVSQSGFTALTAQTLGMKRTARASSQFIAFRVTGTSSEAHLIRGIRVYFKRAEPSP